MKTYLSYSQQYFPLIQKVYKMNEMVENHDHTIGQIEVEMGLPPGIKVHLNSKESRAFAS